jgi:hypothetical protein
MLFKRLAQNAFALVLCLFAARVLAQGPAEPFIGQPGKDVVWLPLPDKQVEKLLDMAKLGPADFLVDLGSGDGRLVIAAAKRGVPALGVEFNDELVTYSRNEAAKAGVSDRAQFVQGDLFEADLSRATVITLFLLESMNVKLRPSLLALKPGTRILANTFGIGDWAPDVIESYPPDCEAWCAHFLWIVPARVAGIWRAPEGELVLAQRYQKLGGTLGKGGLAMPISNATLEGDAIRFTSGGAQYRGRVRGDVIEGTIETGAGLRPWIARRAGD